MTCVKIVSYEFCVNGTSIGTIVPTRGLRQGDPLSPYLFLFCVEGLSATLNEAVASNTIFGTQVSPTAPVISHLLFADDSFLFFKATNLEANNVTALLEAYAAMSGQCVNHQKSSILYSKNVSQATRTKLFAILGVHNDLSEGKVLWAPFSGRSFKETCFWIRERQSLEKDSRMASKIHL